jgi:transposase
MDSGHARRALAIIQLWETGGCVAEVARRLCAARSSVQRWRSLFEQFGVQGLERQRPGRADWKADDKVLSELDNLVKSTPKEHGYIRSRWSSGLLAVVLAERIGIIVHASSIRRWLARLAIAWRRARPTLHIRDPRKNARMRALNRALADGDADPYTEVFYADEADVDLNPRIGSGWMPRAKQHAVPTPGKNRKRYLAGALHARTGRVVCVEHENKSSLLFIRLLYELKRAYRRARRIVLIVDNYAIHKSRITRRWLANNPKVELVFQPAYCPWVNVIERLWKALHDTVTRNHQHTTMESLMKAVWTFVRAAQPFPGAQHALTKAM